MPPAMNPTGLTIGLDADDTLWHNERYFIDVTDRFVAMCRRYVDSADLDERLSNTERRNLALFGYGAKGFTLSLIETAIEVTGGRIAAADIHECIEWCRWILAHPVELLDGVAEVVDQLSSDFDLVVITKGDLLHQEAKMAGSGLAERFRSIEVVNEKDPDTYRRVLDELGVAPDRFVMVGNSVKSDVLPVLEIGALGVHIPYETTWVHEIVHDHDSQFPVLGSILELPGLIAQLDL
ncbi:MAG: HAD family hydrolase [Acidimicrobiia bacterium]